MVVGDGAAAFDFYRRAFDVERIGERFTGPSGGLIHAEVRIGDSSVMITEDAGDPEAPARSPRTVDGVVTALMACYWQDVAAAWQRAVAAGAEVLLPRRDHVRPGAGG